MASVILPALAVSPLFPFVMAIAVLGLKVGIHGDGEGGGANARDTTK